MRFWQIVFLTICEQLADKVVGDNRTLHKGKFRVNSAGVNLLLQLGWREIIRTLSLKGDKSL